MLVLVLVRERVVVVVRLFKCVSVVMMGFLLFGEVFLVFWIYPRVNSRKRFVGALFYFYRYCDGGVRSNEHFF